jgi:hypothetical protein
MPVKIYHVGLPPDRAPVEVRETIGKALENLKQDMIAKGYDYHLVWIVPEDLENLKKLLTSEPPDGLLVGGGILRIIPFFEQVVNVVHEYAPKTTKLLFITSPPDSHDAVHRWFPNP